MTQADLEKNARHVRGVLLPPDVNVIPWADPTRNLPPYWQPVELFWVLPSGRLHMERNLMRVARTSRDIADCRAQLLDEVRRLMEQGAWYDSSRSICRTRGDRSADNDLRILA